MNQTDDRILELLEDSSLTLSPAVIAENTDYARSWVSTRLGKLKEADLVSQVKPGYYRISDAGSAYLVGDLNASELERDDE